MPRPDKKDEDLGLKYLDEPSASQSDPTVLELQLRAMSKKLQYGNVVVRSIENAAKNPIAIEKWIQSICELHRSKPPPQVLSRLLFLFLVLPSSLLFTNNSHHSIFL